MLRPTSSLGSMIVARVVRGSVAITRAWLIPMDPQPTRETDRLIETTAPSGQQTTSSVNLVDGPIEKSAGGRPGSLEGAAGALRSAQRQIVTEPRGSWIRRVAAETLATYVVAPRVTRSARSWL